MKTKAKEAFDKVKAKYGKPKKRLRKVSKRPTKALGDRADRALQDWYRAKNEFRPCEACNRKFELCHHFIEKSQSASLRFDEDNLIFLCSGCHFRHHGTGDQTIMAKVILGRGQAWLKRIMKRKFTEKRGAYSKSELEAIIKKYEIN